MKKILVAVTLFLAVALWAQTATPPWTGLETQQLLASCTTHGSDNVVCVATDGVAFSYQGAAFVKVSSPPSTTTVAYVQTVNGKKPDATGNVALSATTSTTSTSTTTLQ